MTMIASTDSMTTSSEGVDEKTSIFKLVNTNKRLVSIEDKNIDDYSKGLVVSNAPAEQFE